MMGSSMKDQAVSSAGSVPESVPFVVANRPWPAKPSRELATAPEKKEPGGKEGKGKEKEESDSPFAVSVVDVYEGPLDLLLDLIRKQDIDIYDIPIARITE